MKYDSVTKIFLTDPGIPEKILKTEKKKSDNIQKECVGSSRKLQGCHSDMKLWKICKKEIGIKLMEMQRKKYQPVLINAKNIF